MAVILAGTDFSTRSDRALRRAVLLARQGSYELLLVHVIDDDQPQRMVDAARGAAEELLASIQHTLADEDSVACRTQVRFGRVPEQMIAAAQECGAALILIGPRRPAPLRDWLGATTAERIIRRSPMPLLSAAGMPSARYRHLLLPTDFGAGAHAAADAVRRLTFAPPPDVTFLHAYDAEARQMLGRALVPSEDRRRYLATCEAAAREALADFVQAARIEHAGQHVRATGGAVARDILEAATEEAADLIVLCRSNKGLVEESVLGSVTEDVLRAGELDVLVVPEAGAPTAFS